MLVFQISFCLRPKQVAEHHSDEHRKDVSAAGEAPNKGPHSVAHRVSARSQGEGLFEHEQERDPNPRGRDQSEDRLG